MNLIGKTAGYLKRIYRHLICLFTLAAVGFCIIYIYMKPYADYAQAKVIDVYNAYEDSGIIIQPVKVVLTGGIYKELVLDTKNYITQGYSYNTYVKTGDTVILKVRKDLDRTVRVRVYGYYRSLTLFLGIAFFLLFFLLITGFSKNIMLLSVLLNASVTVLLVTLIIKGFPPLFSAVIFAGFSAVISLVAIYGFNRKFISSFTGVFSGILAAAVSGSILMDFLHISGRYLWDFKMLVPEDYDLLWGKWNYHELLVTGITIACLGVLIRVADTVAETCYIYAENVKKISGNRLFAAALKNSKNNISAAVNAVFMVVVAGALPVVAVFVFNGMPFSRLINLESFSVFILYAVSIYISILVAVPVTAVVSARFFRKP